MYDLIIGLQLVIDSGYDGLFDPRIAPLQKDMARGLTWFREITPKAYMALLD